MNGIHELPVNRSTAQQQHSSKICNPIECERMLKYKLLKVTQTRALYSCAHIRGRQLPFSARVVEICPRGAPHLPPVVVAPINQGQLFIRYLGSKNSLTYNKLSTFSLLLPHHTYYRRSMRAVVLPAGLGGAVGCWVLGATLPCRCCSIIAFCSPLHFTPASLPVSSRTRLAGLFPFVVCMFE